MPLTSRDRVKKPDLPLVLSGSAGRRLPLRILFVHRDAAVVKRCVRELNRAHLNVSADVVLTQEHFIICGLQRSVVNYRRGARRLCVWSQVC
jgi:hypothetical protein